MARATVPTRASWTFRTRCYGPVTYDLVSLLRDCYVAWPIERVRAWADAVSRRRRSARASASGASESEFLRWFDLMGVQRHLKAIGIFARLWHRDGKPGYLKDIPRTLNYVRVVSGKYRELQFLQSLHRRARVCPRSKRARARRSAMRAMILAAGRGERMRPLTDTRPKPLLEVGGKPLIQYHIEALARAGIARHRHQSGLAGRADPRALGDGSRASACASATATKPERALETGGGIFEALPLLGAGPFLVVSGDIWTEFPLASCVDRLASGDVAHFVLVPNPDFHAQGDFGLRGRAPARPRDPFHVRQHRRASRRSSSPAGRPGALRWRR